MTKLWAVLLCIGLLTFAGCCCGTVETTDDVPEISIDEGEPANGDAADGDGAGGNGGDATGDGGDATGDGGDATDTP